MSKVTRTKQRKVRCRVCGKLVDKCIDQSWPVVWDDVEEAKCCTVCYYTYIINLQRLYELIETLKFLSYEHLILFLHETKSETDKLLLLMMDIKKVIEE